MESTDLLPALKGVPGAMVPTMRGYISHLVGSRVSQRTTSTWSGFLFGIRHVKGGASCPPIVFMKPSIELGKDVVNSTGIKFR